MPTARIASITGFILNIDTKGRKPGYRALLKFDAPAQVWRFVAWADPKKAQTSNAMSWGVELEAIK